MTSIRKLVSKRVLIEVMESVVPHAVVVELCRQRVSILELDDETFLKEAQNMDKEKVKNVMKNQDFFSGVMHSVLLKSYADISRELGVAPGGEFRRAYKEMKKIPGCKLYLGDRQIQVTIARAFGQLSLLEILQILFHVSKKPIKPISTQELEKYKSQEYINNQFKEITHDFPGFKKIFHTFVDERDICLAYSIQEAVKGVASKPARVVAVVGMGHVAGIVKNLGSVKREDVMKLLSTCPMSPYRRMLRLTIKYTILFLIFSFFYRIIFG